MRNLTIILTLIILIIFPAIALSAPDTFIIAGPSGTLNSRDFAFFWTGRTTTPDSFIRGFYYRLDSGQWNWTQDRSLVYYDFAEGNHRLEVKAVDSDNGEDPTPAVRTFTLQQNFALEPNEAPFSIQREFQSQLDSGIISQGLRQEFLNNGRILSLDASVATVTSGSRWQITDRNIIYKLKKESNKINVYQDDYLFRMDPDLEADLNGGTVTQALLDEFDDNDITLAQSAAIVIIAQGREWLIDEKYTVKKESGRLNVYQDELLFGVELFEYIVTYLNNKIISPGLGQEFKLNNIILSSVASVLVEESSKKWLITDSSLNKTFIIIKETNQNKLNIFESINDSPSEAIFITPGTTIKAASQPDSDDTNNIDEDWFRFSVQSSPSQNKHVTLFFKRPNAFSSSTIRLYRYPEVSDGSEIARFTARYSQFSAVSLQQSADYLVKVTPGTGESPSTPYFLTVMVDDLAPGLIWEREPNNSSGNATDFPSIALSKTNYWVEMVGSKWSESDNKDYFRLHTAISEPARLSLNLTNPQSGTATVKISPAYQLSSEMGRFQVNPGSSPQWKLEVGIKPGDYILEVELPSEQDQNFLYFLTLQLSDFPFGETWELEPNDSPSSAVANPPFPIGSRFRASKGSLDTKDWFKINIPKNGILNLTTSRILKSGALNIYPMDPVLQSPVGSPLTYQVYEEPQLDYINLDVLTGSYFIEVDLSKVAGDYWIIAQLITSVSHDAPIDEPLTAGQALNIKLVWESGNSAAFDLLEIIGNNTYASKPLNKSPIPMYDDGLHNDGQKDDGIYGGTYIVEPTTNIQQSISNIQPKDFKVFVRIQDKNGNKASVPIARKLSIDLSPPDDIPPEIVKVSHDATVPLRTGEKITVTIEGEVGGIAAFDLGDGIKNLPAYDDGRHSDGQADDGKYMGNYTIKAQDYDTDALVTGHLTDKFGNVASLSAANSVDIVGNRPAIISINHSGRLALGLDEILKVTMIGDPDGIASFNIEGLVSNIPMYDDGQHDDGDRGDGKYVGTYKVIKNDGVTNAPVIGRLVDRNGRETAKTAFSKVTIDAVSPDPVANVKAYDRPDDQGKFITLTWNPTKSTDFSNYNIYMSAKPISSVGNAHPTVSLTDPNLTKLDIEVDADLTDYFFAVTAVDRINNESELARDGSSAAGPVQAVDNLKPAPVKVVKAVDRDQDFGGVIIISWTDVDQEQDFDHYNIYQDTRPITTTSSLRPIDSVMDRYMTIVDIPAVDDTDYYFAVTAVDSSNNESDLDSSGGSVAGPVSSKVDLKPAPDTPVKIISGPVGTIHYNHVAFHWNKFNAQQTAANIQNYYIRLDNSNWQWTTNSKAVYYNLSPGAHTFSVRMSSQSESDQNIVSRSFMIDPVSTLEREPNDSSDLAYIIRPGVMVRGGGDNDWFRLHIPESYRFNIPALMDFLFTTNGSVKVTIYNAQPFQEISSFDSNANQPIGFTLGSALTSDYLIHIEPVDEKTTYSMAITIDKLPSGYLWEIEDNGRGNSANQLPITTGQVRFAEVRGTSAGQQDLDYFKVHIPDELSSVTPTWMNLSFYKPNPEATTTVEIYSTTPDISDRQIGQFPIKPLGQNPLYFSAIVNPGGDYFIKVNNGDEGQHSIYNFLLSLSQASIDQNTVWEAEPNDLSKLANPLLIGIKQSGTSWDGNNDNDWFKLNAGSNGILNLNFSRPSGIGSSTVEIYDASLMMLGKVQSDLASGQKGSINFRVKAGIYYVKIDPQDESPNAEYILTAQLIESISITRLSPSGEKIDPEIRPLRASDKIQLDLLWILSPDGKATFDIGDLRADLPFQNQGNGIYRGAYTVIGGDNQVNAPIIINLTDKFGNIARIELDERVSIDTELPYIQEIFHNGITPLAGGKKLTVRLIGGPKASAKFDISGFKTGLDMYTMTPDVADPPLVILNWDWRVFYKPSSIIQYPTSIPQIIVTGKVKNISDSLKDRVKLMATFYDVSAKSVAESFVYATPRDIPAGVTSSFKLYQPYTGKENSVKLKLVYASDEKTVGESINDGVYVGEYLIGNNDNITDASIICYLTDGAGNQFSVQAEEKATFDNIPPVIKSLDHDARSVLVEGDVLTVTMEAGLNGEPDGKATFDIGDFRKDIEMSTTDSSGKKFAGIYRVKAGDQVIDALIKGNLKDAAGNPASYTGSRPVSINTSIPDIAVVSHNGGSRPFIQGETLIVTVRTTPGSTVTFNIEELLSITDRPMYDDGQHDDDEAGDGLYKGTYVIRKGDNVKNAKVKVKVVSPNGKIVVREALEPVSIDTEPPVAVTGVRAVDTPYDEGGYITLTWTPTAAEDFHHYNIYQSDKPIINITGLTPLNPKTIESDCSLMDAKCTTVYIQFPFFLNSQLSSFYFAVTVVDNATNESPITRESTSGPVTSIDNLPPLPVGKVSAYDRAFDNGKVITVTWTDPSIAEDFYRYQIYMSTAPINSTSGLTPVDVGITDRNVLLGDIITSQDDVGYFFAVTALDFSGNESNLSSDSVAGPVSSKDNLGPPPDTLIKIISGPVGEIHYDDVTFRWNRWFDQASGSVPGYYYKLDNANWVWTNQTEVTYYDLREGQHSFYVRADLGVNAQDPMPANRVFAVKRIDVPEMEPNNNSGNANWISKGMTIFGNNSSDDDDDWFRFYMESTGLMTFHFNRFQKVAGAIGTTVLSIYKNFPPTPENKIGYLDVSGSANQRKSFSTGIGSGDYFIFVDSQGESPESQYEISVTTNQMPQNIYWDTENNDSPSIAQLLDASSSNITPVEVSGFANKEGDTDWYQLRFTGLKTGTANFADIDFIRPQGAGSTVISLYASFPVTESPKVGEVALSPINGFVQKISLPIRTGDYYLKIDSSQETNLSSIYSFRISLRADTISEKWELEPNGVLQFANMLSLNEVIKGTSWHPNDDLDWYKVRLDSRGTFVVSFFRPFGAGATGIILKSANGGDVSQVPPAQASQLTGQKATISANLNLGDYYVVIDPENEEDPSAEYNLVATVLDSIKLEIQRSPIHSQLSTLNPQLSVGDSIKLTVIWRPGNTLTFDIGDLALEIPMYDDGTHNDGKADDGVYAGAYVVKADDNISDSEIILHLSMPPFLNSQPSTLNIPSWTADLQLEDKITIDTTPPKIVRVDHDARLLPLAKGKVLNVTMTGEAGALEAFFDIVQDLQSVIATGRYSKIPMKEEPEGTYTGSYTIGELDNLNNGYVIGHLIDTAGNESTKPSEFTVTFDTKPPEIIKISHDATKVLVEGDMLTITVESDTIKGKATFSIGELVKDRMMYDDGTQSDSASDDGIYTGRYTVQKGDNITDAVITIHLMDEAGNVTERKAFEPVSIDTAPPKIDSLTHDATKVLSEEDILTVTLKGDPGNTATFDIGDFQMGLPMYDDGTRFDETANDGIYIGTYVVKKGDSAKDMRVTGYLNDKNGNQAVSRIFERVDIDAVAPQSVMNVKAVDKPDDQGFSIILTWSPSSEENFDHYSIYRESAPVTSVLGLTPVVLDDSSINLSIKTTSRAEVIVPTNEIDYYFAVTVADLAGNESPVSREEGSFGPVKALDNLPPGPVTVVSAQDRPDDQGRTIIASWTKANQEEDFDHYSIYLSDEPIASLQDIKPVLEAKPRDVIYFSTGDIGSSKTVLGVYVTVPADGVDFYLAVTAFDKNGNQSSLDSKGDSVAGPVKSKDDKPPKPVLLVDVYDTPQDDGGSVDLIWEFKEDEDIDKYSFYLSQQLIDNDMLKLLQPVDMVSASRLIVKFNEKGTPVMAYQLNTPSDLVNYYIAITAIDLSGNVSLLDSAGRSVMGPVQSVSNTIRANANTTIHAGFDPNTSVFVPAGGIPDNETIDIFLPDDLIQQEIDEANRFLEKSHINPEIDSIFSETARDFNASTPGILKPVTITLSYPDLEKSIRSVGLSASSEIQDIERHLRIFRLNETSRIPGWEYVSGPQQIDTVKRTISVKTSKLGVFRIAHLKLPEKLDNVVVYPNPFIPSQSINGYITFKNLTENATIQIYDMAGRHVQTIQPHSGGGDEARWDARNKKDEEVASGTYIFMIQSDSASYVGKVVILR